MSDRTLIETQDGKIVADEAVEHPLDAEATLAVMLAEREGEDE